MNCQLNLIELVREKIMKQQIKSKRPVKKLFLGAFLVTIMLMIGLMYAVWYIAYPGLYNIYPLLPVILGTVMGIAALIAIASSFNMLLATAGFPYLKALRRPGYELIGLLFPFTVKLVQPFGISRRKLEGSFIAVSNLLFNRLGIKVPADKLLVVTPHCLQLATCPHKITRDPHNCKRCGGCDIGALVTLADEMGFHFFVATGGTLARQIVYKTRPKAVLAIACERDLMSGIQDVYPLPAVGVLNIRPNGPCYNTHVDIEAVKEELAKIIIKQP